MNITLNAQKAKPIWQGHPWVFPKAIQHIDKPVQTGQLVKVFDARKTLIGAGIYNEHSLYRVRMLAYHHEPIVHSSLAEIIPYRLQEAINLRKALLLPNFETTAYRLFNSEGDGLSGLTIDVYEDVVVVASSSYWVEENRPLIEKCIDKSIHPKEIVWNSQEKPLKQDGWLQASLPNDPSKKVMERVVKTSGILYHVKFHETQKTGLFLDQRENHQRVATLAKGKRVLDFHSYTGGFGLHAAKSGAQSVVSVDSSQTAVKSARENAILNHLEKGMEFICSDAMKELEKAKDCDLLILDPPKLVPSRRDLNRATRYYQSLHEKAFSHIRKGGLVFTSSCSSAMTQEHFLQMLKESSLQVKKEIRILGTYGAASDHPTLPSFPEGKYLHAVLLTVL